MFLWSSFHKFDKRIPTHLCSYPYLPDTPRVKLHDSSIHVRSNDLGAEWTDHHTDYSYYSLLLHWIGGSMQALTIGKLHSFIQLRCFSFNLASSRLSWCPLCLFYYFWYLNSIIEVMNPASNLFSLQRFLLNFQDTYSLLYLPYFHHLVFFVLDSIPLYTSAFEMVTRFTCSRAK